MSDPAFVSKGDQWAKIPCGCWVEWDGHEWIVAASSFLCDHKQGDHVDGAPPHKADCGLLHDSPCTCSVPVKT